MYYVISFEIASVIILMLLILCKLNNFKSSDKSIKRFMYVTLLITVTSVMNILAALCYSKKIPGNDQIMLLYETVYLLLAVYTCFMQLMVIVNRFVVKTEKIRLVNFIIVSIITLILCLNLNIHFMFEYIDHVFTGYTLFNAIYLVYVAFFIQMGVFLYKNRNAVRRQTFYLSLSIMILPILGILIQFIDDRLLLSDFGATMAFLIYSYSLEDQNYAQLQKTMAELEESKKNELKNQDRLRSINQVKSLFMESISEEFKSPIEGIINANNELKDKSVDKEVVKYTNRIDESANELLEFVDEMMVTAKEEEIHE